MPLYIGDYLGDTTHLSQGQHGAYMLFIMHYWQRGPIPRDKEQCYCIAHAMDMQSKRNADAVLKHFFKIDGDVYRHTRIDLELEKAQESYKRRSGAALARWSREKEVMQSRSNGDALHEQSQSQSLLYRAVEAFKAVETQKEEKGFEVKTVFGKEKSQKEIDRDELDRRKRLTDAAARGLRDYDSFPLEPWEIERANRSRASKA